MNNLLLSAAIALCFSLLATPLFIRAFNKIGWGQFIRDDGPQSHHTKRGTPTMGGVIFILATLLGYFLGKLITWDLPSYPAILVLFLMTGLGVVGFIDDFMKVRNQRSLGLTGWAKVAGQVIVGAVFAVLALNFPDERGQTPASFMISGARDIEWLDLAALGLIVGGLLIVLWIVFIVVATSNAVNVTDGLDGLATGASILAVSAYVLIGFWQFNQSCFSGSIDPDNLYRCYPTSEPLDLAVVAASLVGALIGFLWWNTSPAQVFMGDVGSLGIGGAIAGLAVLTHTELLLLLIAGLPIIVTGSVIVQRIYFKLTKGKRIFLMSPLHHHFELKGWAEITVVVRFWIIAGLFVAGGVGLFYLEWQRFPFE
ncbi:phospho-N-acetylmuramoyl-pentapeptide-transferase [Humidisolicoccus flavus]|uniref:phospho-N-acetylmuramoyl-pentapeptide- transferase n=1 Tax=Humidisolicoccus flavus TaxID=3111414 RepID=UPI003252B6F1